MPNFFNESKMKTDKNNGQIKTDKNTGQPLSDSQKKLVELMIPVVQQYYSSKHLSKEDAREVIVANIKALQGTMGEILGNIINSENEQINRAIAEGEQSASPSSPG